jgi:uncharacterized glyoxalase superfamily protein PhnB
MPISPIDDPAHSPLAAQSLEASFTVADIRQSLGWYRETLGFTVDREFERDGRLLAVSLRAGTARILLSQDDGAKGLDRIRGDGFSLQFTTLQDVDAVVARAKRAGAKLETEPTDARGARVFRLRDPDGFRLVISSPREA